MTTPQTNSATILVKVDELRKQFDDFARSMMAEFVRVHEELDSLKEKLAAAPKKTTTRSGTSKSSQTLSPAGKKPYNNKMLWWKDMFAANYDQFVQELFTPELESDGFIEEAEANLQDSKGKEKVGDARYKAIADYIWKQKIRPDGFKKFKDAVMKKFEEQSNGGGDGEEATAEGNNDDESKVADVAEPETNSVNDNAPDDDADGDAHEDGDSDESETPPAKATPKKSSKTAATTAKAPAKPAAKGPAKTATKSTSKTSSKGPAKAKK
jgi:hypothetical protein